MMKVSFDFITLGAMVNWLEGLLEEQEDLQFESKCLYLPGNQK